MIIMIIMITMIIIIMIIIIIIIINNNNNNTKIIYILQSLTKHLESDLAFSELRRFVLDDLLLLRSLAEKEHCIHLSTQSIHSLGWNRVNDSMQNKFVPFCPSGKERMLVF